MRTVAVVGTGNIGSTRALLLASHAAIDRVLVCDVDEARTAALVAQRPDVIVAASLDDIVETPGLGGVIVATRAAQHADIAQRALDAGIPTLVEKPFTGNPQEAQLLVDAAVDHSVPLFAGYTQRFRRKFLNGFEQLQAGRIGDVRGVFARFHSTRSVASSTLAKSQSAVPVRVLGPHLMDLVTWYLGGRLPQAVEARTTRADLLGTGIQVPSTTFALLDYGTFLADVVMSWQLPTSHPASHASIHLEVIGTDGYLVIDDSHTDVVVSSSRAITQTENAYTGASSHRAAFLQSYPPGDPVLGSIHGPVRDETYAFAEVACGAPSHPILATGAQAVTVAEVVAMVDQRAGVTA